MFSWIDRCKLTPRRFKRYPLGTLMMFFWGLMGLSLFEDGDGHPWPYLAWPTEVYIDQADDAVAYGLIGWGMMLASVLFLVGHALDDKKAAKFSRWVGLWMAISTSTVMIVGILVAHFEGYPMKPWWPFSILIWVFAINAFVYALRIVRFERFECDLETCARRRGA